MGATPLTLRCPRCKKNRVYETSRDRYDNRSDKSLVPTGKTKVIGRTTAAVLDVQAVQVCHDGIEAPHLGNKRCGHVFWTTHPSAVRKVFPDAESGGNATVHVLRAVKRP